MELLGLVTWIPQRVWEIISGRKKVSLLVHFAYFSATGRACYFLNVTNLSRDREVEVTHVWFALNPQVHALAQDRLPPKRLKPDETWETWVEADRLPLDLGEKIFTLGRVRLSDGREVKSRKNKRVPTQGIVPGGPITRPPG